MRKNKTLYAQKLKALAVGDQVAVSYLYSNFPSKKKEIRQLSIVSKITDDTIHLDFRLEFDRVTGKLKPTKYSKQFTNFKIEIVFPSTKVMNHLRKLELLPEVQTLIMDKLKKLDYTMLTVLRTLLNKVE